jgi:hypothetical protein
MFEHIGRHLYQDQLRLNPSLRYRYKTTRYFPRVIAWMLHHGPLPKGKTVVCVDQNNDNLSLDNLLLIDKPQEKGYHWDSTRRKFQARLRVLGGQKHLGYFDDSDSARQAYLAAVLENTG